MLCEQLRYVFSGLQAEYNIYVFTGELLPFFPTTDSGDVSSIKDVDILEVLRVPSSC